MASKPKKHRFQKQNMIGLPLSDWVHFFVWPEGKIRREKRKAIKNDNNIAFRMVQNAPTSKLQCTRMLLAFLSSGNFTCRKFPYSPMLMIFSWYGDDMLM
jgi:hypothetical protein